MKNLIVMVFILVTIQSKSQPFEGTVTWTVNPGSAETASIILKVKDGTVIAVLNGGMMNGTEMWFSNNNTKVMRVMRQQKMFVVLPPEAVSAAEKSAVFGTFTKTAETATILGYSCAKYTGEIKEQGRTMKISFWTTTQLKDDAKLLVRQPSPFGSIKLPADVPGIPLRIEKPGPKGTDIMEVTEIKPGKLNEADFKVPADFTQMGK